MESADMKLYAYWSNGQYSFFRFFAISNFPTRRKLAVEKIGKAAEKLSSKVDEAIQQDISRSANQLVHFVETVSKPYQDACQQKIDWLQGVQGELSTVERKLQTLKVEIQNLHESWGFNSIEIFFIYLHSCLGWVICAHQILLVGVVLWWGCW
jgi:hypothetical protein